MMRASATRVLFFGSRRVQAATPIQSMAICTAPDGAVYSIVSNFVYPMLLMTRLAN